MFLQVKSWSIGRCQTGLKKCLKQDKLYILTLKYEVTKLVWQDYFNYLSAPAFPIPQGLPFDSVQCL